jgi:hypothetical protein
MRDNCIHILALAACFALAAPLVACDKSKEKESTGEETEKKPAPDPEAEARARERADAFGLPLPPRVLTIQRNKRQIKLTTDMTLRELEEFFKKSLPEHEVFLLGTTVRAVPLRESLPSVRVLRPHGPRYPKEVIYSLKIEPKIVVRHISEPSGEGAKEDVERGRVVTPSEPPKPGSSVRTRTASGELLAPGAKWGEPYTPPEGSPLHTERNRHNFGRPYGEWIPD